MLEKKETPVKDLIDSFLFQNFILLDPYRDVFSSATSFRASLITLRHCAVENSFRHFIVYQEFVSKSLLHRAKKKLKQSPENDGGIN